MENKNDNLFYIVLLPVLIIVLLILSAIGMSDTQFKQFESVETEGMPQSATETTP